MRTKREEASKAELFECVGQPAVREERREGKERVSERGQEAGQVEKQETRTKAACGKKGSKICRCSAVKLHTAPISEDLENCGPKSQVRESCSRAPSLLQLGRAWTEREKRQVSQSLDSVEKSQFEFTRLVF